MTKPLFKAGDWVSYYVPGWRGKPGFRLARQVHKIYFRGAIAHIPASWRVQVAGLEANQDHFKPITTERATALAQAESVRLAAGELERTLRRLP